MAPCLYSSGTMLPWQHAVLYILSEKRQRDAPFQSAQLSQSAQTAYARIAGVGVFAQVVYHLMAVVGAHRY